MAYIGQGDSVTHSAAGLILDLHYAKADGLNPGSGTLTTWTDLSGNGLNGTLNNFGFVDGSGWSTSGLTFDGIDDYCEVTNFNIPHVSTWQIAVNISRISEGRQNFIMYKEGDNSNCGFVLYRWKTDNKVRYTLNINTTSTGSDINIDTSLLDIVNNLDIVTIKIYNDKVYMIINNVEYSVDNTTSKAPYNAINLFFCRLPWGDTYNCDIAFVRVYNRYLSINEVIQNYTCGIVWEEDIKSLNYYSYIIC
jgi:hypothetical protein